MTVDQFITKYEGKFVEYHSYGTGAKFQCVDLCNQYIVEVLGQTAIIGTNAQDFPSKASKTDYDYILNTPTNIPQRGDLMIFKSADKVGHISIFLEGDINKFTSLDQNYPTGSPVKKVVHTYTNVLGWLRPITMTDQKCLPINEYNDLKTDSNNWKFLCTKYDINDPSQIVGKVAEYEAKITGLENAIEEDIQDMKEVLSELEETREEFSKQGKELLTLKADKATLTDNINTQSIKISEQEKEIKDLKLQLASIPQTPEMTPTISNVLSMLRLVIKDWLK